MNLEEKANQKCMEIAVLNSVIGHYKEWPPSQVQKNLQT